MGGFRQPEIPRMQCVLWEHRLDDAIPAGHPVRDLVSLLSSPELAGFFRAWEEDYVLVEGRPPYHPRDLAGLYILGMLSKVRSSRQLEAACFNRLDFIWLMSGQRPDHSTISAFVTKHAKRLQQLFKEIVAVALRSGLLTLSLVAIDGTVVEADASKQSIKTREEYERLMAAVEAKLEALKAEWRQNEASESLAFGDAESWQPKSDKAIEKRRAKLQQSLEECQRAKAVIERRTEEARSDRPPKPITSKTDPDSRVMKDKEGRRRPSYNAQLAVDADSGLIVALDVNDKGSDSGLLTPMIEKVTEVCGKSPKGVVADAAYNTGPDLERMEALQVTTYLPDSGARGFASENDPSRQIRRAIQEGRKLTEEESRALPKGRNGTIDKECFVYDEDSDCYRCPAGGTLPKASVRAEETVYGPASECATCPLADQCYKTKGGRKIYRDRYEEQRDRLRSRMAEAQARQTYAQRAPVIESKFGEIKAALGFRRFQRRGFLRTLAEWTLMGISVNFKRMLKLRALRET